MEVTGRTGHTLLVAHFNGCQVNGQWAIINGKLSTALGTPLSIN
jgi:hypothetical protein